MTENEQAAAEALKQLDKKLAGVCLRWTGDEEVNTDKIATFVTFILKRFEDAPDILSGPYSRMVKEVNRWEKEGLKERIGETG
jgi:hypothetical protein